MCTTTRAFPLPLNVQIRACLRCPPPLPMRARKAAHCRHPNSAPRLSPTPRTDTCLTCAAGTGVTQHPQISKLILSPASPLTSCPCATTGPYSDARPTCSACCPSPTPRTRAAPTPGSGARRERVSPKRARVFNLNLITSISLLPSPPLPCRRPVRRRTADVLGSPSFADSPDSGRPNSRLTSAAGAGTGRASPRLTHQAHPQSARGPGDVRASVDGEEQVGEQSGGHMSARRVA